MIIQKGQPFADPEAEGRAEQYGASERLRYSDAGGLTQFGAHVETLQPGSRFSGRHWHEVEDESSSTSSLASRPWSRRAAPIRSVPATRPAGRRAWRTPTKS